MTSVRVMSPIRQQTPIVAGDVYTVEEISNEKPKRNELFMGVGIGVGIVMVLVIIVLILFLARKNPRPSYFPTYTDNINVPKEILLFQKRYSSKSHITQPTILVSISSYRDPELCVTIEDLFHKALNPERVSVGVVEQNSPTDSLPCHAKNARVDGNRVKITTLHYTKAKGPTYARSLCEKHWQGEDYYLMCDSHMRFEPGWDAELLDMLAKTERPKRTIITMYPEGYERIENKKEGNIRYKILVRRGWRYEQIKYFNGQGILEFESVTSLARPPKVPPYVPMFSGNFSFCHSDFLAEVPYPANTPFLFFGEEQFMAARAFTHGWDLVAPTHSVIYHHWKRDYRPVYFNEVDKTDIRDKSIAHVKAVMEEKIVDPEYGLGTKRTMDEFWNYLGVNNEKKEFTRPNKPWRKPANWTTLRDEFYRPAAKV